MTVKADLAIERRPNRDLARLRSMERSQSSAGDDAGPCLQFNAKTPALKGDLGALA